VLIRRFALFLLCALALSTVQAQSPAVVPEPLPALATPAAPLSSEAQRYLGELQAQGRQLQLSRSLMWRTLLHYRVHPITRVDRSLADDPDFFMSPHGARDPAQELDATLAAFFDSRPVHALAQSAACRLIARYQWLDEQLHFDGSRLPKPDCQRFETWRQSLHTDRVTLIFPSAYLNSPASMYGHTFLRLDTAPSGTVQSPMLSYAISYAANGSSAEGLAFAIKGLTGLYDGQFANGPYYLKIAEYNELENRDIWEYELALSPAEIQRLVAHTWELGPTRFDYYFFDENCAYHLLSLLDAARPELQLSDQFTWWAIPLDTVRAVTRVPGLVAATRYRPSNSTELKVRAEHLGPQASGWAQALAKQTLSPAQLTALAPQPERRALILETAERLTTYDANKDSSDSEAVIQQRRMRLLAARASLPAGEPVVVPTPANEPTSGHDTARATLQYGQRQGHGLWLLEARPAYHDLMDPQKGFQRGAAIAFGDMAFSKTATGPWQVERFTPVSIQSFAPHEPLLEARSWRVDIGATRSPVEVAGRRPVGISLHGGPGRAWELRQDDTLLAYAFVDNQAWWDRNLQHRPWAAGSGLALGLIGDLSERWRVQAEGFARAYLGGAVQERGGHLNTRWQLNHDWNLTGQCQWRWRDEDGQPLRGDRSCTAGLQRYF
jgi:hypothetical protein